MVPLVSEVSCEFVVLLMELQIAVLAVIHMDLYKLMHIFFCFQTENCVNTHFTANCHCRVAMFQPLSVTKQLRNVVEGARAVNAYFFLKKLSHTVVCGAPLKISEKHCDLYTEKYGRLTIYSMLGQMLGKLFLCRAPCCTPSKFYPD